MSFGFSLGGVDIGGSALSGLSDFAVNSGGGGSSSFIGDMFSGAASFAGDAFGWIEKNPEAAQVLGGVAVGAGQGYIESRNARKERELQRELLEREIDSRRIAPGEMGSNYGSYRESVTQGLISNGMLASADEED